MDAITIISLIGCALVLLAIAAFANSQRALVTVKCRTVSVPAWPPIANLLAEFGDDQVAHRANQRAA